MAREDFMKDLTIRVRRDTEAALDEMKQHAISVWNGDRSDTETAYFTYSSPMQLFEQLTPDRWELIERLQGMGEVSLRTLARAIEQPLRLVHEDALALIELHIVERTDSGRFRVPYETIRIEFAKDIALERSKVG
jgi:predicted transcriptional regulator